MFVSLQAGKVQSFIHQPMSKACYRHIDNMMKLFFSLLIIVLSVSSCVERKPTDITSIDSVSQQVPSPLSNSGQTENEDAVKFITKFMNNTYFHPNCDSEEWGKEYLTDRMYSYLEEMYLSEADSVEGHHYIAEWAFETKPETGVKSQDNEPLNVYHHKNNWYVVQFGGGKRTKMNSYLLKIIKEGNKFKIDNIRNGNMGFDGIPEN